jgi:protein-L-isoaspartate(D-aspartate) O-methyltransferase
MTNKTNTAHFNMLEQQIRPSDVLDAAVLKVMSELDRAFFVDDYLVGLAYADTNLPIGFGQVMLSPVLQGRLLQALKLQSDETVLEIGTGNGYFTTLLAKLAKHVTTVDMIKELSDVAQQRLKALHIDNVTYEIGDASSDWHLADRIDVIVMTASMASVPENYLHHLTVGGRMLSIVGQGQLMTVQLTQRTAEREWQTVELFETVVPSLINAEPQPEFEF